MAVMAAVVLTLAAPGAARGYEIIQAMDGTGDGVADLWTLDDNGDGIVDRLVMDSNQDGVVEVTVGYDTNGRITALWLDTNMDHFNDSVLVPYYANGGTGAQVASLIYSDVDQNGLYEHAFYDSQLDGYYEWVAVDTNADGVGDAWRGNLAPAGHTATDQIADQIVGQMMTSQFMYNYLHNQGMNVFFPSLPSPVL